MRLYSPAMWCVYLCMRACVSVCLYMQVTLVQKHEDKPVHPATVPAVAAARDSPIAEEEIDEYEEDWDADSDVAPSPQPAAASKDSAVAANAPPPPASNVPAPTSKMLMGGACMCRE